MDHAGRWRRPELSEYVGARVAHCTDCHCLRNRRGSRSVLDQWFEGSVAVGECTRDRKSTRLNSSHMSISYAVFCLKKKKKKKKKTSKSKDSINVHDLV